MPLTPRARSAGARANDERILDAALREIASAGIDRLRMNATAARAALTTGALYGRYESAAELAVDVWQRRLAAHHRRLLDALVAHLVDRTGGQEVFTSAMRRLRRPDPADLATVELLLAARRVDELGEVITEQVASWFDEWGAGPTGDERRRADVASMVGLYWGASVFALPGSRAHDWATAFVRLAPARDRRPAPSGRVRAARLRPPAAATGEPLRDALIDATATVIARSGVERATVSRIARRAGMTDGAVYTRYASKDLLVADAVDVLLAAVVGADAEALARAMVAGDVVEAAAGIAAGGLAEPRAAWRRFRLEAYLGSRHHPQIRTVLRRRNAANIAGYRAVLGDRAEPFGATGQALPIGLSVVQLFQPDLAAVDFRTVLATQVEVLSG